MHHMTVTVPFSIHDTVYVIEKERKVTVDGHISTTNQLAVYPATVLSFKIATDKNNNPYVSAELMVSAIIDSGSNSGSNVCTFTCNVNTENCYVTLEEANQHLLREKGRKNPTECRLVHLPIHNTNTTE